MNFFDSLEYLEPRCPKCKIKIEFDVNTRFDEKLNSQVCLNCGHKL